MADWKDKLNTIVKISSPVTKIFVPEAFGKILDGISKGLDDSSDSENRQAIEKIVEALVHFDARLQKLESKK